MARWLWVGTGGFLGALARYGLAGWVQERVNHAARFPAGTLAVNLLGAFLLGALAGLVEVQGLLSPQSRAFLMIGFLGSFTTFSTFSYESLGLLRDGRWPAGLANLALHLLGGLLAVALGYGWTARR